MPRPVRWREVINGLALRHLLALNRGLLLRTISLVAAYGWFTRTGARARDVTLAAKAVLMNLHCIAICVLDGFANAKEALVGGAVGAQKMDDCRAVSRASTVSEGVLAAMLSLVCVFADAPLAGLFAN